MSIVTLVESSRQGPPGPAATELSVTDIVRDGQRRVVSYRRAGVQYTVDYQSATTIVVTGGGITKTVTLDVNGDIVSSIVS